jgi:large subunit ribosomal protein L23
MKRNPYDIIKSRYITEKSATLLNLHVSESNRCVKACKTPKYVFLVDLNANKKEIAAALTEIYAESKIRVLSVNTIRMKPKRFYLRNRESFKPAFKKAIVTLAEGSAIPENLKA